MKKLSYDTYQAQTKLFFGYDKFNQLLPTEFLFQPFFSTSTSSIIIFETPCTTLHKKKPVNILGGFLYVPISIQ